MLMICAGLSQSSLCHHLEFVGGTLSLLGRTYNPDLHCCLVYSETSYRVWNVLLGNMSECLASLCPWDRHGLLTYTLPEATSSTSQAKCLCILHP